MNRNYQIFKCDNCHAKIETKPLGTCNRNHCPNCLWSKHVDANRPGDRKSDCQALMEPIGLSFKAREELVIVHKCLRCREITKNRIAGDDDTNKILSLIKKGKEEMGGIKLLSGEELEIIKTQLFGKIS